MSATHISILSSLAARKLIHCAARLLTGLGGSRNSDALRAIRVRRRSTVDRPRSIIDVLPLETEDDAAAARRVESMTA